MCIVIQGGRIDVAHSPPGISVGFSPGPVHPPLRRRFRIQVSTDGFFFFIRQFAFDGKRMIVGDFDVLEGEIHHLACATRSRTCHLFVRELRHLHDVVSSHCIFGERIVLISAVRQTFHHKTTSTSRIPRTTSRMEHRSQHGRRHHHCSPRCGFEHHRRHVLRGLRRFTAFGLLGGGTCDGQGSRGRHVARSRDLRDRKRAGSHVIRTSSHLSREASGRKSLRIVRWRRRKCACAPPNGTSR
mmetsp:Transcript_11481/g.70593  ORF Transcript_11481/g.70593 Transcript_11481/m.70593 type:complete len:242 (+) Transcript_11481:1762-2487(+)